MVNSPVALRLAELSSVRFQVGRGIAQGAMSGVPKRFWAEVKKGRERVRRREREKGEGVLWPPMVRAWWDS